MIVDLFDKYGIPTPRRTNSRRGSRRASGPERAARGGTLSGSSTSGGRGRRLPPALSLVAGGAVRLGPAAFLTALCGRRRLGWSWSVGPGRGLRHTPPL